MLNAFDAVPMIAVKDLQVARRFYEQTLGFQIASQQGEHVLQFKTGKTLFNVYQSAYGGTNKATSLTWNCGNEVEAHVSELRKKDVSFIHYDDMPGVKRTGDIHVAGEFKMAWFKDPDGNIMGLMGR